MCIVSPLLAVLAGRLGVGLLRIESPHSSAIVEAESNEPYGRTLASPDDGRGPLTRAVVPESRNSQAACSTDPTPPAAVKAYAGHQVISQSS